MSWFKKLFGSRKDKNKLDLENDRTTKEIENVSFEFEITASLNDKKTSRQNISINTSIEKLDKWLKDRAVEREMQERNKANPNSVEREPNENEVTISVSKIDEYMYALPCKHPLKEIIFDAKLNTIKTGCNNIILSKDDYSIIERHYNTQQRIFYLLRKAKEYEENGDLDSAIEMYEEVNVIWYHYTGSSPDIAYSRLVVLYRKKKDSEREVKTIEKAIELLTELNKSMAQNAIIENQSKKDEIIDALPLCKKVKKDDGFLCFNPYDTNFYTQRLEKLLAKKK